MADTLYILGIVFAVLGGGLLITSIIIFFKFKVPTLWKDSRGSLEQSQIEEMRSISNEDRQKRGKANVFEDMEKKAKEKYGKDAKVINRSVPSVQLKKNDDQGTTLLSNNANNANNAYPDFVIEKNIMFVSTNDVI